MSHVGFPVVLVSYLCLGVVGKLLLYLMMSVLLEWPMALRCQVGDDTVWLQLVIVQSQYNYLL